MSILSSLRFEPVISADGYQRWIDTPTFSYKKWLDDSNASSSHAIAAAPLTNQPKVAIIGAGASGLCAAYELEKCGFLVDIYEASPRAGGRMDSYSNPSWGDNNLAELGAMRFTQSEELLFHYLKLADPDGSFDEKYPIFPDPGVVQTLISYRDETPILWKQEAGGSPPKGFEKVFYGWSAFVGSSDDIDHTIHSKDTNIAPDLTKLSQIQAYLAEGTSDSISLAIDAWQVYLDVFGALSFFDGLTRIFGSKSLWHPPGKDSTQTVDDDNRNTWKYDDFDRFGTLGVGSGGFSALYAVGFNTVARLIPNGLETQQRLILKGTKELIDFFTQSLQTKIHFNSQIISTDIAHAEPGQTVTFILTDSAGIRYETEYETVIWATNLKAMSMSLALQPMLQPNHSLLNPSITSSMNDIHVTSSSKLFLRTKSFWKGKDSTFPRVILSGVAFQQLYTIDYNDSDDPEAAGMVLISYTWEDDSNQALPLTARERLELYKVEIGNIYPAFSEALVPYSDYDTDLIVIDWQAEKYQYGAFALNQAGQDVNVKTMFSDYLRTRGGYDYPIYFAGDGVSWCGGWVESALQTGLNAAAAVINYHNMQFTSVPSPMNIDPELYNYDYTWRTPY